MKATETPSQAEIGRALGVVRSRVTALKKQGMPVDSVENALRWHRRHVMAKVPPIGRDFEAAGLRAVEKVEALGRILPDAADRGDTGMVKEMRAALRAVPRGFRRLIDLPQPVWMLLVDHL